MSEGLIHAQMVVLELPPRLSVSSRVNLLSLKGTWMRGFSYAKAEMQLASAAIDLLMFWASLSLIPSDPVFDRRSEPAKSTNVSNAFL